MIETLAVGLLTNGMAGVGETTASKLKDKIQDALRSRQFDTQVDDLATEFNDALQREVPAAIADKDIDAISKTRLEDNWADIATQLDQIDVAFEDDREAAARIARAIETGLDVSLDDTARRTLEDGVLEAYQDAIRTFVTSLEDAGLTAEFQTAVDIELTSAVTRLEDRIDAMQRQLRIGDLHSEGFVQVDSLYLQRHDPGDPVAAWQRGFDLAEVAAGYPLARQRPADDPNQRHDVAEEVIDRLDAQENLVVLGQRGSGKSTVCRTVACRWQQTERGPVYYRDSRTETTFDDPGALISALRYIIQNQPDAETHPLVVVEDCVSADTKVVYEVLNEFTDEVAFLFDARHSEWDDAEGLLSDARLDTLRQGLGVVSMPTLDATECQRAVDHFETVTGKTVGRDGETLYDTVRNADIGGPLLLAYELTGPGGESGVSALRKDVQNAYEAYGRWADENRLKRQVGILVSVLIAAQLPVNRAYLYGLADNVDDTYDIDEALSELERIEVIKKANDDTAYLTPHQTWASLYLERLLSSLGEWQAMRLFEACVNALFDLVDNPDRRDKLQHWLRTNGSALDRIETAPAETADQFVTQIARIGTEHPPLAPLFGTNKTSRISVPESCSEATQFEWINRRGWMHFHKGNLKGAETEFNRLLTLAKASDGTDSDLRQSWALGNLGLVAQERSDLEAAEKYHKESLEICRELGAQFGVAQSLNNLGLVARDQGDLKSAEDCFEKSLTTSREVGYRYGTAESLNNLGLVALDRANLEVAERYFEESLVISREVGDDHGAAQSLRNLGLVASKRGDLEAAEESFQESLAIFREIGDDHGAAESLYNLEEVLKMTGNSEAAEKYHKASQSFKGKVTNRHNAAASLINRGTVALQRGDLEAAEESFQESLAIFREIGDDHGTAQSLNNLGLVARRRGDLEAAEESFQESLTIFREIGDDHGAAQNLRNLGLVARKRGDLEVARPQLKDAVHLLLDIGALSNAEPALGDIVDVCEAMSDVEAAKHWCEQAIDVANHADREEMRTVFKQRLSSLQEKDVEN